MVTVSTAGATMGYIITTTTLPSDDNFILKYDAGANTVTWEADVAGDTPTLDAVLSPAGAWTPTMQDTEILTMTFEETDADPMIFLADGTFGDISIVSITQSGAATDGTMLEIYTVDADVDHLMMATDDSDSVTHKIIDAGTYTIDVTSDGTAAVSLPDPVTMGFYSICLLVP